MEEKYVDLLVFIVIDEDSNVVFVPLMVTDTNEELQELAAKDVTWLAYMGGYDFKDNSLSDYVYNLVNIADNTEKFPTCEFRNAKNPKVITVYI